MNVLCALDLVLLSKMMHVHVMQVKMLAKLGQFSELLLIGPNHHYPIRTSLEN